MDHKANQEHVPRPIVRFSSNGDLLHHVGSDAVLAAEVCSVGSRKSTENCDPPSSLHVSVTQTHKGPNSLTARRMTTYLHSVSGADDGNPLRESGVPDEAEELAGMRMARVASGRSSSQRSSVAKGGPEGVVKAAKPTVIGLPPATLLLPNRGITRQRGATGIPFWIISCFLMSVPLIFVTTYLGMSLDEALRDLRYTSSTADAVGGIFDLQTALMFERFATTSFFAVANGTAAERAAATAELAARQQTSDDARTALGVIYQNSQYPTLREDCLDQLRRNLQTLDTLRYQVGAGLILRSVAHAAYTTAISGVVSGLTVMGRESSATRLYLSLRGISLAVNYLGMCRSTGMLVLLQGPKPPTVREGSGDISVLMELATQCAESLRRVVSDAEKEADGPTATTFNQWEQSGVRQELVEVIYGLESRLTQNSSYFPLLSASNYTALATDNVQLLLKVVAQLRSRVQAAETVRGTALAEALKLSVTLVLSCIAIGVVGRAQGMATKRVDAALDRTDQMAKSVQAFIPQDFLSLMQVESILKLERGDRHRVRIAMLFCDIRNFTGISERMSNEQLFDWLQAHLMAMARTTERHGGFVDKFIGDAVSSVFLEASDAVRCGVSMQAATDALCFELIASNQDHMVRIGVGVHFGEVEVGVLGNEKHLTCVIISPEVNVAAQLEASTKVYGARILISEPVMERLQEGAFSVRPLGEACLSADAGALAVFEVYTADPLPLKKFKDATTAEWGALLTAQKHQRFGEVSKIAAELQRRAEAARVSDPALGVKGRASHPWDVTSD